jgi:1-acyl-sn-glycerol-3-phosphate acyltransferase
MGVLVVFDVAQRIAVLVGERAHERVVAAMAWAFNRVALLAGARVRVRGLEQIDWTRRYLVVANHQSVFDLALTSEHLAALRPRYVARRELARGLPGISFCLRASGAACIERRGGKQAFALLAALARRARASGWSVVIFPEGRRARDGVVGEFKVEGLRALARQWPGVAVLPVATWGGAALFARGLRLVRNVELGYRVLPPMAPPDPGDAAAFAAFVADLRHRIATAVAAAR